MHDNLFQVCDYWTKLKEKKKKFTKANNQFQLDNAQLEKKIAELKINNLNLHNLENTHFVAEIAHFRAKNAKLTTNITKIKRLTYFNKLDSDNAAKTTTFKDPAIVSLLKVKNLTKSANLSEFTSNKDNKTIDVKDWISQIKHKLEKNADHFPIVQLKIAYIYGRTFLSVSQHLYSRMEKTHLIDSHLSKIC